MQPLDLMPPTQIFRVALASGVWQVSQDGAFFGHYLTRGNAIRAACAGARDEERRGRAAQVFEAADSVALPHHEPHLGA